MILYHIQTNITYLYLYTFSENNNINLIEQCFFSITVWLHFEYIQSIKYI